MNVIKEAKLDLETNDMKFVRVELIETDKRKKTDVVRYGIIYKDIQPKNPITWTDEEGNYLELLTQTAYEHIKSLLLMARNAVKEKEKEIVMLREQLDVYKTTYKALESRGVL